MNVILNGLWNLYLCFDASPKRQKVPQICKCCFSVNRILRKSELNKCALLGDGLFSLDPGSRTSAVASVTRAQQRPVYFKWTLSHGRFDVSQWRCSLCNRCLAALLTRNFPLTRAFRRRCRRTYPYTNATDLRRALSSRLGCTNEGR